MAGERAGVDYVNRILGRPEATSIALPLGTPEIEKIIPHRAGFLLVKNVLELDPGKRAVAEMVDDPEHPMLQLVRGGHFPGYPLVPGVIQGEALNQAGAIAIYSDPRTEGLLAVLAGADAVKYRQQVVPGETLRLETEITDFRLVGRRGVVKGRGVAFNSAGKVAAEGNITCGLIQMPTAPKS